MSQNTISQNIWNPNLYQNNHDFVWQYGESLLELLQPQPGERILDLGCGTGQLTAKIAEAGAAVVGMDADNAMIAEARRNYPTLQFLVGDARNFLVEQPYKAIFSNAALHWVQPPEMAIASMFQALQSEGRLVAEFGGKGNVQKITEALFSTLEQKGYRGENPWYFPSIGEYTTLLEQQGWIVTYAGLFDRPTVLKSGVAGLSNWLKMFGKGIFTSLTPAQREAVIQSVEAQVRSSLWQEDHWIADYRRLRIIAYKP